MVKLLAAPPQKSLIDLNQRLARARLRSKRATMLWDELARDWQRYSAPIRPGGTDVARFGTAIAGADRHVLLLGVTPQLAGLGQRLTAIDLSQGMLELVWPGDTPSRVAILGDWLCDIPQDQAYSAVLTDGGFSVLRWPDQYVALLHGLRAAGSSGLRLAARCHFSASVQDAPDLGRIASDLDKGLPIDRDVLRFRVLHALAAARSDPNVPVRDAALIAADLLEAQPEARAQILAGPHARSDEVFSFPEPGQLFALIEDCGFSLDPMPDCPAAPFLACTAR